MKAENCCVENFEGCCNQGRGDVVGSVSLTVASVMLTERQRCTGAGLLISTNCMKDRGCIEIFEHIEVRDTKVT